MRDPESRAVALVMVLVVLIGPGWTDGANLQECKRKTYPDPVSLLAVNVQGLGSSPPDDVLVAFSFIGSEPEEVEAIIIKDKKVWVSDLNRDFLLRDLDLLPQIPEFRVEGPVDCGFLPIDEDCSASYIFKARRFLTIAVEVEPTGADLRVNPQYKLPADPRPSCIPEDSAWRRVLGNPEERAATREIVAALEKDPLLRSFAIGVRIVDGVVTLVGRVGSDDAIVRARELVNNFKPKDAEIDDGDLQVDSDIVGTAVLATDDPELHLIGTVDGEPFPFSVKIPDDAFAQGDAHLLSPDRLESGAVAILDVSGRGSKKASQLEVPQSAKVKRALSGVVGITIRRIDS